MTGIENPKIVLIGGGHGPSAFRRGLKEITPSLTSIVPTINSGGSIGRLRDEYNSFDWGDMTQAWADHAIDDFNAAQLRHRYQNGSLNPHRVGNIVFHATEEIYREGGLLNPELETISRMKLMYPIVGNVLPITLARVDLVSLLENGDWLQKEHQLDERDSGSPIIDLQFSSEGVKILPQAAQAIKAADVMVYGPGSHHGSIECQLIVPGFREALENSKAIQIYAVNIANVKGQTQDWGIDQYVKSIQRRTGREIDYILYFTTDLGKLDPSVLRVYEAAEQQILKLGGIHPNLISKVRAYDLVVLDTVIEKGLEKPVFRHNVEESAAAIMNIWWESKLKFATLV